MLKQSKYYGLLFIMVYQFWLSGLFILGIPFTYPYDLDNITMFMFFSLAIGNLIGGICSDKFGRKPVFLTYSVFLFVSALFLQYSILIGLILASFSIGPLNNLTFVIFNQSLSKKKVQTYIIIVLIGWAFSEIILGIYFYYCSKTQLFIDILLVLTLIYTILVFLIVKQTDDFEFKRATKEIQIKINKKRNSQKSDKLSLQNQNSQKQDNEQLQSICKKYGKRQFLKPILSGGLIMFSMQIFYYYTQFTLDKFGISIYLNFIILGCMEIFANFIMSFIVPKIERKVLLMTLIFVLIVFVVLLNFCNSLVLQTVFQGLMRFFGTSILILLGIYLPELFKVSYRGLGTNIIMSFGVIGSAFSQKTFNQLPFWFLSVFLAIAFVSSSVLQETRKKKNKNQLCRTILTD